MAFYDWVRESRREIAEFGADGIRGSVSKFLAGAAKRVGRQFNFGTCQFGRDWDVLVLLDCCRPDYLNELHRERQYDWIESVDTLVSKASSSVEWINKCLKEVSADEKRDLAIISGNGWTERELDISKYHSVETLPTGHWDDQRGILPPEEITNYAIRRWREDDPGRMLVWYMQPHAPYPAIDIAHEFTTDMGNVTENWTELDYARVGVLSDERLRAAYRETLEIVLTEVGDLTNNLDAENVYLSADHAELLGEWGLYEHPRWAPIPRLKRVPWVELKTTDLRTREPDTSARRDEEGMLEDMDDRRYTEDELDGHLKALGYML